LFSFYGCTKIRKDVLLYLCMGGMLDIYEHFIRRSDWIRMSFTERRRFGDATLGMGVRDAGFQMNG
jgi:hypothetical protein